MSRPLPPAVAETLALRSQGLSVRHIARLRGVKPITVKTVLNKHAGCVSSRDAETLIATGSVQLAAAIAAQRDL